jgi:hypothetical protein
VAEMPDEKCTRPGQEGPGEELGVTRERIRQIELKALHELYEPGIEAEGLFVVNITRRYQYV